MDIDFFQIDETKLDKEWLEQPELFAKWAIKLADSRELYERAKAERDVLEAEIALRIRKDPTEYLDCKVTEATIAHAVLLDKEMRSATEAAIKAKHEAEVHQAVVNALEHRKDALENAVRLHAMGYFSVPRAKGEGREAEHEMLKREARTKGRRG